ncbi:hypothetical protein NSQ82_14565 [Caldifermentibacillus hisashii]|uniref:hypothetical protein n=1 Tax=Caldifermentibacillus hisashii TaxID=996558 RepID=UPI0031B6ACB6
MVTRIGLVAKIETFPSQNGDEKLVSSPKNSGFHRKMVTRMDLVVKIKRFSPKNGDEIESRRQNRAVFTSNW